jgi:hypothetical protein
MCVKVYFNSVHLLVHYINICNNLYLTDRIFGECHYQICFSYYFDAKIVDIKIRRLGWAERIIRMEEERIPKRVLNGNFHTTKPVGRPRTRWADVVQRDASQLLGIRGWRSIAAK